MIHKIKSKLSYIFQKDDRKAKIQNPKLIVSLERYNLVYFPIPKVACSSFFGVFADLLKEDLPEEYYNENWKPFTFRDQKAIAHLKENNILITDVQYYKLRDQAFSFTFVRNPWDRLSSCFHNKIAKEKITDQHFTDGVAKGLVRYEGMRAGMSFSEFIDQVLEIPDSQADAHIRSQHRLITNLNNELVVDYVGKFENLEQDFSRIAAKANLPSEVTLNHLLKSNNNNYRKHYTAEDVEKVSKRYAQDIKLFKYEF